MASYKIFLITSFLTASGVVTWIKLHGGKISAWIHIVRHICDFGDDLNSACADGKATPEEMQKLCDDYTQLKADLGLLKGGTK